MTEKDPREPIGWSEIERKFPELKGRPNPGWTTDTQARIPEILGGKPQPRKAEFKMPSRRRILSLAAGCGAAMAALFLATRLGQEGPVEGEEDAESSPISNVHQECPADAKITALESCRANECTDEVWDANAVVIKHLDLWLNALEIEHCWDNHVVVVQSNWRGYPFAEVEQLRIVARVFLEETGCKLAIGVEN